MTKQLRIQAATLCSLVAIALFSCFGNSRTTNVQIEVHAQSTQGEALAGASIIVNQTPVGKTDEKGFFITETKERPGSVMQIEVSRSSDANFYAPYMDSFVVSNQATMKHVVRASLFAVPKPNAVPASDPAPSPPALAESAPESLTVAEPAETATPPIKDEPSQATAQDAQISAPPLLTSEPQILPEAEVSQFTVQVFQSGKAVPAAEIFLGGVESGTLKFACLTSARGRCFVKLPELGSDNERVLMVKKADFLTHRQTIKIVNGALYRVNLERGHTIDIFAMTKVFHFVRGLPGVDVFVNGKAVGTTDEMGHFSHIHKGPVGDLVPIALKAQGKVPEVFETDFVASGPMTLVRYFASSEPPPVRLVVAKAQPAGQPTAKDMAAWEGAFDQSLQKAVARNITSLPAFKEVPRDDLARMLKRERRSLSSVTRAGWQGTQLKGVVDAILVPTVATNGDERSLELSVIDSNGKVVAAARETIDPDAPLDSDVVLDKHVKSLAKKVARTFPFEGAVTGKNGESIVINIGRFGGRDIAIGDRVDVYGMQTDPKGKQQRQNRIAVLRVKSIEESTSVCTLESSAPRSMISRGDLITLRPSEQDVTNGASLVQKSAVQSSSGVLLTIVGGFSSASPKPVGQANVYLDEQWLGASDQDGTIILPAPKGSDHVTIRVIRSGFSEFRGRVNTDEATPQTVRLRRETAFLRIASVPEKATVKIDDKVIGQTPLRAPVAIPSGFVKLSLEAPGGYKTFKTVLELDEGTFDLTGPNAVKLEKDLLAVAESKVKAGRLTEALDDFARIPSDHSDHLMGLHRAGQLLLGQKGRAREARQYLAQVLADPSVQSMADKRFIGSFVNFGVASVLTAEGTTNQEESAILYREAASALERVEPQLRFVPKEDYQDAVQTTLYYAALARHRLWKISDDPVALLAAWRSWRSFMNMAQAIANASTSESSLTSNAATYFAEAQTALNRQSQDGSSTPGKVARSP